MAEGTAGTGTRVEEAGRRSALKVLAAVDASEESLHALSWALDNIVRGHPDAELVIVHAQNVVDPRRRLPRRRPRYWHCLPQRLV
ncbi:hypothetical protein PR202_ga22405 [Eleusine coracana subsp. coracana]|uniref:UspA domain-containing protein n=1 Tax=Eleusine coracana subsp. coracana TaxID=191504 RepID=A0AAV5D3J3_ELECO|nr:hypothetical protein PR202_ga22405 [Eleusine coracana subsp. coracana]